MPRSTSDLQRTFPHLCRHLNRRKRHLCLGAYTASGAALASTEAEIGAFEGKGAANLLALDSRRVGDEDSILDPNCIVRLSAVGGRLELPVPGTPCWNAYVARLEASEKRWVALTCARV